MTFDEELRQALRPGPAPRGLADRVLARLAASDDTASRAASAAGEPPRFARRTTTWRVPSWMGLGVAASLVAVVASSAVWLEHDRQRQAREARADVLRALAITNQQLHDIQALVTDTSAVSGDQP